ncbi:MAG: hypothetical protein RXR06_07860 [Thermoproteus sp.]
MRFIAFSAMQDSRRTAFGQYEDYHHTLVQAVKRPLGTLAHSFGAAVAVFTSVKMWKYVYMSGPMLYYVHPPNLVLHYEDVIGEETRERITRSYILIPGYLLRIEEVKKLPTEEYKEVRPEMAILTSTKEYVYAVIAELALSYDGQLRGRYIFKPVQFQPLI